MVNLNRFFSYCAMFLFAWGTNTDMSYWMNNEWISTSSNMWVCQIQQSVINNQRKNTISYTCLSFIHCLITQAEQYSPSSEVSSGLYCISVIYKLLLIKRAPCEKPGNMPPEICIAWKLCEALFAMGRSKASRRFKREKKRTVCQEHLQFCISGHSRGARVRFLPATF